MRLIGRNQPEGIKGASNSRHDALGQGERCLAELGGFCIFGYRCGLDDR
jgi:hypothetical protein